MIDAAGPMRHAAVKVTVLNGIAGERYGEMMGRAKAENYCIVKFSLSKYTV